MSQHKLWSSNIHSSATIPLPIAPLGTSLPIMLFLVKRLGAGFQTFQWIRNSLRNSSLRTNSSRHSMGKCWMTFSKLQTHKTSLLRICVQRILLLLRRRLRGLNSQAQGLKILSRLKTQLNLTARAPTLASQTAKAPRSASQQRQKMSLKP